MSRSGRSHPLAARSTIRRLGRNALQNRFHLFPCLLRTARHDRSSVQSSLFSSRDTGTDEQKTFRLCQFHSSVRIFIIRVTTVNQYITRRKIREKLLHQLIHRTTGTYHHHYLTRQSDRFYKSLYIREALYMLAFSPSVDETFHHAFFHTRYRTIIHRYAPTSAFHVQS